MKNEELLADAIGGLDEELYMQYAYAKRRYLSCLVWYMIRSKEVESNVSDKNQPRD